MIIYEIYILVTLETPLTLTFKLSSSPVPITHNTTTMIKTGRNSNKFYSTATKNTLFSSIRQTWLRRNTFFLATVFGAALVGEIVIDGGVDRFWEWNNRGKLWKDLEAKIIKESEENE